MKNCFKIVMFFIFFGSFISLCGSENKASGAKRKNIAVSNEWGRISSKCIGFKEESDVKKYIDIITSRDYSAADKYAAQLILSENADLFKEGTEVFVEKISIFRSGSSKVRRRGETQSWWVAMDFVEK